MTHYISNDPGNESRSFEGVTRAHQFDHWLVGTREQPTIRLLFFCLFLMGGGMVSSEKVG